MRGREENHQIKGYERVFNVIGWVGFLAIIPIALNAFGNPSALEWLEGNLGRYGTGQFLLIIFYILVFVRVIFGSGRIIMPLVISAAVGFILMSTAVEIPFMAWYRNLVAGSPYFGNHALNFLTGLAVVLLGILMSYLRRMSIVIQLLILVVLPAAFLVFAGAAGLFSGLGTGN